MLCQTFGPYQLPQSAALNLAGKNADRALAVPALFAGGHQGLHYLEGLWIDNKGTDARTSESACVAELMKLYRKLTEQTG